jgi:hypothetical protein
VARCALNVSHPKFVRLLAKSISTDPDLNTGLTSLQDNLAKDHRLCHWVNHPMPGYPQYKNRIWKWDFNPDQSSHSGTRKGWRLYAYVTDPEADPVSALAFFCYAKSNEPGGNPATWITAALKKFLAEDSDSRTEAERFRHQIQPDQQTRSLCLSCGESVCVSLIATEIEEAERIHQCANS